MNKKRGTLLRLCKYLMRYKWGLLLAVLLTVGSNLFSLVGPELSGPSTPSNREKAWFRWRWCGISPGGWPCSMWRRQ